MPIRLEYSLGILFYSSACALLLSGNSSNPGVAPLSYRIGFAISLEKKPYFILSLTELSCTHQSRIRSFFIEVT